jgi:hypothetical protein
MQPARKSKTMPTGIKATDLDTGRIECVNIYRHFYMNKAEAIRRLEEDAGDECRAEREE